MTAMVMYQHDSATMFRFVLRGGLIGDQVQDLEHAWNTAKSILAGKELVVDISGITSANRLGFELLSRMRESGARLTAALPPESEEFLRSLGVRVAAPCGRRASSWPGRLLRLGRVLLHGCPRRPQSANRYLSPRLKVSGLLPAWRSPSITRVSSLRPW